MNQKIIALLTDFGLSDHFVGTMKGVILTVDPAIRIFDISHNIQPQNILEAAYTLADSLPYWPGKTVIAAVVDPGVGTGRRSVLVVTRMGHKIVCPDNGLLSLVIENPGISEVFVMDEGRFRLPGSESFHTFHGRDIYAYNAARLVSGDLDTATLEEVPINSLNVLPAHKAAFAGDTRITGNIVKIEKPFGNLVSNIPVGFLNDKNIRYGDKIHYIIYDNHEKRLEGSLSLLRTFGEAEDFSALVYVDSSGRLGFSINKGDFSDYFQIGAGLNWKVEIRKN